MDEKRITIPVDRIKQSIVLIRGQKVILDRDLANLYCNASDGIGVFLKLC